ncbi:tetratricopeptide repeat protein [Candidatus Uabimicrobium sp. HlEnr_7]|uniref:tetratricopeptide repeat protein n=1 Tax=Candidatus Uabimicrobium helgolandensis TaxID=3095367 RepID=UPI003557B2F4
MDENELKKRILALEFIDDNGLEECVRFQKYWKEQGESLSLRMCLLKKKYLTPSQIAFVENMTTVPRKIQPLVSGYNLEIGSLFHHYNIQAKLGYGGMGVVYKALDTKLNRIVALKLILSVDSDSMENDRFLQETEATACLEHPNVVHLFDAEIRPVSYFTMEYIDGENFSEVIYQQNLTYIQIAMILYKCALALDYIHENGIIHRDIKPGNIMITANYEPKIMDFGLAKIVEKDYRLSQTGEVMGTLFYMSPEQVEGKKPSKRMDIYSLGATLYEAITKRPPFQGESYFKVIEQISLDDPIRPCILNPDIPKDLESVCLKSIEKLAFRRYKSAKDFANDLRNFIEQRPINASPPNNWTDLKKYVARNKLKCSFALALFCGFLATIIGYVYITKTFTAQLVEEKNNSINAAKAIFKPLQQVYLTQQDLRKDETLLAGIENTFQELQRLKILNKISDDDFHVQWMYGLVCGQSKNDRKFTKGIQIFDELIKMRPENMELRFIRGTLYAKRNFLEKALNDFTKCIQLQPGTDYLYSQRGLAYKKSNRYELANNDFTKALKINPDNNQAYKFRGTMLYAQKKYRAAEKDMKQALELNPKDAGLYTNLGTLYRDLKKYKQALYYYSKAIRVNNKSDSAYRNRARLYIDLKKLEYALRDIKSALDIEPQQEHSYYLRGTIFEKQQQYNKALQDYSTAIKYNSKWEVAYEARARVYALLKKYQLALEDLSMIAKLNPQDDIYMRLGNMCMNIQNEKKALYFYNKVLEIKPNNSNAHSNIAVIYKKQKNYNKALQFFNKAISLNPSSHVFYGNRGNLYAEMKLNLQAEADYTRAIKLNPTNATFYLNRGLLYETIERYQKGIDDYNIALSLSPENPQFYFNRGVCYYKLKKYSPAIKDWKKCIHLGYKDALKAKKYIKAAQQRFK